MGLSRRRFITLIGLFNIIFVDIIILTETQALYYKLASFQVNIGLNLDQISRLILMSVNCTNSDLNKSKKKQLLFITRIILQI